MKEFRFRFLLQRWIRWGFSFGLLGFVVACSSSIPLSGSDTLNSYYNDEQPALSGNGRFLGFVSNRNGSRRILLYDLKQQRLIPLLNLKRSETIAENPSLSYTGRYITYIVSEQGKPTVALYDRSTQESQLLTQGYFGWVRHPSISPDGRYVVFESGSRSQWEIEVLDRGPNVELDIPEGALSSSSAMPSP